MRASFLVDSSFKPNGNHPFLGFPLLETDPDGLEACGGV